MTRDDAIPLAAHGGDVESVARALGIDPARVLDVSANLNPLGPPPALLGELVRAAGDLAELGRYPEPTSRDLRGAIARRDGIDPDRIVVANGAAPLIETALAALGAGRCLLPVPAFSEDARALAARGVATVEVALDEATGFAIDPTRYETTLARARPDVALLTDPHNPSGASLPAATLHDLVALAARHGCATILDEAFVDFTHRSSLVRDVRDRTVVLRSLTKFFAVPALRVGYAVAEPALAARMRALLPPGPVTTIAARALIAALDDPDREAFARRTRATVDDARDDLRRGLRDAGFTTPASAANFVLVRLRDGDPPAAIATRTLAERAHVLVRDATSYRGLEDGRHLRIAVRGAAENARVVDALIHLR